MEGSGTKVQPAATGSNGALSDQPLNAFAYGPQSSLENPRLPL